MGRLFRRLVHMLRRHRLEDDLAEELRFHLEMKQRDLEAGGMEPQVAARAARRAVGNIPLTRNSVRDVWIWPWLQDAAQDLRHSARALRSNPGWTATVILTLALGLGVNAATFAITYGTLWKPLPYAAPDRLVLVTIDGPDGEHRGIDLAELDGWVTRLGSLTRSAGYYSRELTLRGFGEARTIRAAYVTADFFDVLGVPAEVGGTARFAQTDDLVVLSRRLALRSPGGSVDAVLGAGLTLGGRRYTVAGVMPRTFAFPASGIDVWIRTPRSDVRLGNVGAHRLIGRLQDRMTLADVQREAETFVAEQHTSNYLGRAAVTSFEERAVEAVRPALMLSLAAGALVLVISCANVALLLLGRAIKRRQDSALRAALGCGRGRLLRASVVEGLLIAAGSLLPGLVLAQGMIWMAASVAAGRLPAPDGVALDRPVVLATILAGLGVAGLSAVVTTWGTFRHPTQATLRGASTSVAPKNRFVQRLLVVAQLALALVLLTGAGLLARTMLSLLQEEAGFEPANVLTVKLVLSDDTLVDPPQTNGFVRRLTDRVRALPGVQHVGLASTLPPRQVPIHIGLRYVDARRDEFLMLSLASVTPEYLSALGTRLLEGRFFDERDGLRQDGTVVLSESAARFAFPAGDPIGEDLPRMHPAGGVGDHPRVIGVVEDIKYSGLDAPRGSTVYVPWQKRPVGTAYLVLRTVGDPRAHASAVLAIAMDLNPSLPVPVVQTLEHEMADSVADRRLRVVPAVGFAGLALAVALVGLFGAVSRSVNEQRPALAIRAAFGAAPASLLRFVLRGGMLMTAFGIALGLFASVWTAAGLAYLLYGVSPYDPPTYVGAALIVVIVSLVASYVPARRVLRIDPMKALRSE